MKFFQREKKDNKPKVIVPIPTSRVEVEIHKSASVHAAQKAEATNQHLIDSLIANGFSLKIYLAAGGQLRQRKIGGK